MLVWPRYLTERFSRVDSDEPTMTEPVETILMDRCYPQRTSNPLCIKLSVSTGNNYKLKPHYISILPRFARKEAEDAYIFIREFEEVCAMMKIQQLSEDAIKLRFIPFALKDQAKKWLYSLTTNSISTWVEFVTLFLKKFFPTYKTAKLRNEINQFRQTLEEPFWKYLKRFRDLLAQCPHHGIEKW